MADPVITLRQRLEAAITGALGPEFAGTDPLLRPSDRADYQANAAMALGKQVGRPPREIADEIIAYADLTGVCSATEVAGPGFINLTLDDAFVTSEVVDSWTDPRLGIPPSPAPETVVVDYSSPNLAKEMHVGHLRSTIIGDALARALEFLGHRVIRQNHVGEWGTQFGMLIEHLVETGADVGSASLQDLNAFYQQANARFENESGFADRARQRVVLLQGGDEDTLVMWRKFVDESLRHATAIYQRLGVTLTADDMMPESGYNQWLPDIAEELEQRSLARIDDGALCAFPAGFTNREGAPQPLIIRKRDGGYLYGTTDLAGVRYRTRDLEGTRLVYVVGAPQSQHLAMVFAVAADAGWLGGSSGARAQHVAFGSVLGPDGRSFKTRSGENIKLDELLDEAVQRAAAVVAEKNPDLSPDEQADVARAIGIGALKYADLSNDRVKDYVFDWDRMLAFEGNTGPYLQYAHARIRSIFRRAETSVGPDDLALLRLGEKAERDLALQLLTFDQAVEATAEHLQPHRLCTYLFETAQAFTTFYEHCPVLRAESEELRRSRLVLCDLTARVLACGLDLLGIEAPDRM
jgi:arginyl-tRNA synthetase